MFTLLLGEDRAAKDQQIARLKQELLPMKESQEFDLETLYGTQCDGDTLKKALIALPAVAAQRLVVIYEAEKLNEAGQQVLREHLLSQPAHLSVILDAQTTGKKNFFKDADFAAVVRTLRFDKPEIKNIFQVTLALDRRQPAAALKILDDLLNEGVHPLQMVPGLVWFWGKKRGRVAEDVYKKGLLVLQEADLNIKRSRLPARHTMEIAVMKLFALLP
ncbi:MAG: hypothetical protein HQL23_02805 [Candidatus Omnitrophica bacterium]|nr:hypothetical protein [Candidatus Omnitrophota bacterium]